MSERCQHSYDDRSGCVECHKQALATERAALKTAQECAVIQKENAAKALEAAKEEWRLATFAERTRAEKAEAGLEHMYSVCVNCAKSCGKCRACVTTRAEVAEKERDALFAEREEFARIGGAGSSQSTRAACGT